ncbi:MAG: type IV secretion system DNA-binding domain-containing protein [Patescibacteria group bacterium]|nr:type IV secretion system DNA-binding domain-containing protein [Patescibacteria group bacterium]
MTNPENDRIVYFGITNFRNQRLKFGIKKDDRRRHMYLIGKTGMGKSTVLENMVVQDILNGEGVAVVDPHGDFAEKIIKFIPNHRINDVVYFNPSDIDFPISFNVMESVDEQHKHLIASGLVGVFKKLWADSWGPRLEYVLRNAILALLDYPGSTLLGVMRILVDKNYRKKVIAKIKDPVVRSFWVDEYSKYPDRFQAEAIAPIQNKVGQFLSTALIRNIVGQVRSSIDIREVMDHQKILILNLSKGRLGEDASALMGAMMITKIQLAAMSRIDLPEDERKDFYLYVDEFQNFATESFANILSEARKYRLNLIIAHQYIEQVEENVQAAVLGNVGTIMAFRIGAADSELLAKEFAPYFDEEDVVNLAKYDIYLKLMIDGVASNPFSATTLPPIEKWAKPSGNVDKIVQVTRERYGKPREIVEDKIARWSGMVGEGEEREASDEDAEPAPRLKVVEPRIFRPVTLVPSAETGKHPAPTPVAPTKDERKPAAANRFTVDCYECGAQVEVNFKPDGIRPVYCKRCFKEIRERSLRKESAAPEAVQPPVAEMSLADALRSKPVPISATRRRTHSEERPESDASMASAAAPTPDESAGTETDVTVKEETSRPRKDFSHPQILSPRRIVRFN